MGAPSAVLIHANLVWLEGRTTCCLICNASEPPSPQKSIAGSLLLQYLLPGISFRVRNGCVTLPVIITAAESQGPKEVAGALHYRMICTARQRR